LQPNEINDATSEGCEILTASRHTLDLTQPIRNRKLADSRETRRGFSRCRQVGGIFANESYPADFLTNNLAIGLNVIRGSHEVSVKKWRPRR
jgi:GDP-L-fucose synthase